MPVRDAETGSDGANVIDLPSGLDVNFKKLRTVFFMFTFVPSEFGRGFGIF